MIQMIGENRLFCSVLLVLFCCALVQYGCAKPPAEEMAKAEKLLEEARAKEANIYAEGVFKKAEAAVKKAKDLVAQKEYKEAKAAAEEAAALAQQAASQVEEGKARMKADAEKMITEVQAATNELKTMVADAIRQKRPVNREEVQALIGKNEVDVLNVKVRLETGKIKEGYEQIKVMKAQTEAQKANLADQAAPQDKK
jgi:hypothetical protein